MASFRPDFFPTISRFLLNRGSTIGRLFCTVFQPLKYLTLPTDFPINYFANGLWSIHITIMTHRIEEGKKVSRKLGFCFRWKSMPLIATHFKANGWCRWLPKTIQFHFSSHTYGIIHRYFVRCLRRMYCVLWCDHFIECICASNPFDCFIPDISCDKWCADDVCLANFWGNQLFRHLKQENLISYAKLQRFLQHANAVLADYSF